MSLLRLVEYYCQSILVNFKNSFLLGPPPLSHLDYGCMNLYYLASLRLCDTGRVAFDLHPAKLQLGNPSGRKKQRVQNAKTIWNPDQNLNALD